MRLSSFYCTKWRFERNVAAVSFDELLVDRSPDASIILIGTRNIGSTYLPDCHNLNLHFGISLSNDQFIPLERAFANICTVIISR